MDDKFAALREAESKYAAIVGNPQGSDPIEEHDARAQLFVAMRSPTHGVAALLAENERLREALRTYGHHLPTCASTAYLTASECDCGILAALEGKP